MQRKMCNMLSVSFLVVQSNSTLSTRVFTITRQQVEALYKKTVSLYQHNTNVFKASVLLFKSSNSTVTRGLISPHDSTSKTESYDILDYFFLTLMLANSFAFLKHIYTCILDLCWSLYCSVLFYIVLCMEHVFVYVVQLNKHVLM